MEKFLGKLLVSALSALIASYLISGVNINGGLTAIMVALVLGLFNTFLKPLLILLTIPITIFTFGLFLLVINILIIKWVAQIVPGFSVQNWWAALWFSIVMSLVTFLIEKLIAKVEDK